MAVRFARRAAVAALALAATACFSRISETDFPSDPIAFVRDSPSEGILSVEQFREALTIEGPDDDLPKYKKPKMRTNVSLLQLKSGEVTDVPDVGLGAFPLDWSRDGARLLIARVDPKDPNTLTGSKTEKRPDGTVVITEWNLVRCPKGPSASH